MRRVENCYLCGATDGLTDDHVPPKSFFPTPRPKNLITVRYEKTPSENFYHITTQASAVAILERGFDDGEGQYLTDSRHKGVFVTDDPEKCYQGDFGQPVVLQVTLRLDGNSLARYEFVEKDKGYREWCIPASVINKHAIVCVCPVRFAL